MRSIFIKTLEDMAREDSRIIFLSADLGYTAFDSFRRNHPDRFINAGIAEANMASIAAGLAISGMKVYCYSIIPFLVMRSFEQIRFDVCYHDLDVTFVGAGGGLSYGLEGFSHYAVEDLALMRTLPNMTVTAPGDPYEVKEITKQTLLHDGPVYMRLAKRGEPFVHESHPAIKLGKGVAVTSSDKAKVTVISTGAILARTKNAIDLLKDKGIDVNLISMHSLKPFDSDIVKEYAVRSDAIFTVEEHYTGCGLGSQVAELLLEIGYRGKFLKIGLPDKLDNICGNWAFLLDHYGLSINNISDTIEKTVSCK